MGTFLIYFLSIFEKFEREQYADIIYLLIGTKLQYQHKVKFNAQ
jgi:hypothetical protein